MINSTKKNCFYIQINKEGLAQFRTNQLVKEKIVPAEAHKFSNWSARASTVIRE